eukprot:GHVT01059193.1.p2 GENE.GHVT01059193.1~~GHVT01059193.1.p2  ORF type:complete len:237 (-),score=4.17 GHVT01059193.1:4579-5289(-)
MLPGIPSRRAVGGPTSPSDRHIRLIAISAFRAISRYKQLIISAVYSLSVSAAVRHVSESGHLDAIPDVLTVSMDQRCRAVVMRSDENQRTQLLHKLGNEINVVESIIDELRIASASAQSLLSPDVKVPWNVHKSVQKQLPGPGPEVFFRGHLTESETAKVEFISSKLDEMVSALQTQLCLDRRLLAALDSLHSDDHEELETALACWEQPVCLTSRFGQDYARLDFIIKEFRYLGGM